MRRSPTRARNGVVRRVERASAGERPIRFGTSGWRGTFGEEITAPRLRVLVRSIADWLRTQDSRGPVLVGFDRRFASESLAVMASEILAEAGFETRISHVSIPTPALTHRLARGGFSAGLVLTASHNPAQDHGLKVFASDGSTILDVCAREIESIAAQRMQDDAPAPTGRALAKIDLLDPYLVALRDCLDLDALRRSGLTVVFDAMHGSGAGVLDRVLEEAGVTVEALHLAVDPQFGGRSPDPAAEALTTLAEHVVNRSGLVMGLATDGDADRFGAVDGTGRVLSETQVIGLLIQHLAETGEISRGIAITHGTGSFVERIATHYGLSVERHSVGFKHLSQALVAGRADVAGEESGGFACARMGHDKDGILAGALLANLVATSGEALEIHLDRLEARFGPSACGRRSVSRTPERLRALERLGNSPPDRVGPSKIVHREPGDGLHWVLEDGGFLIIRRSGTESAIRVYAEATDAKSLELRLASAAELLEGFAKDR